MAMHYAAEKPLPQYIRSPQVCRMLGGITRKALRRLVEQGVLPEPIELNSRLKLFNAADVVEAVSKRTRARKAE